MPAALAPVIQEDVTGCGIASVATLAGVSYREARAAASRLGIDVADPSLWSGTVRVRALMKHYRLRASRAERPFRNWDGLPDLALLATKWHLERGVPFWHWCVFWRGPAGPVVLDPKRALRNNRRTDFGRIRPRWYIGVGRPSALRRVVQRPGHP